VPSADLGDEVNPHSLARLPGVDPVRNGERIEATVLHVDRFGNCITNLDVESWTPVLYKSRTPSLVVPAVRELFPVVTYEKLAPGELGLIKGSQGYLELAANQQSAAALLGLSSGAGVTISLEKRDSHGASDLRAGDDSENDGSAPRVVKREGDVTSEA